MTKILSKLKQFLLAVVVVIVFVW